MKILFFSSYFYPYTSGLTTYPWKILSYLSKNHQITVLTFNHQNNKLKIKNYKLKIVYLPYLFKLSKGFISPQSFFYFLKEIKKTDILILNQPNVEGLFLAILAKIFRKKTISLVHCFLYGGKNIFEKLIFKLANFFVFLQLFLSQKLVFYTKEYFQSTCFYRFLKNKKIYYHLPPIKKLSIDKNYFKKLLEYKENSFLIGFSGRTASEKGIEYLIKAIKNLKLKIKNLKLIFAGPYGKDVAGENNYFLKIKNLLEKNKIFYKFLGNLKENQLGAFYKTIDVLALPSINSTEAFGMVQAEAIILGTPVVASNLPGVNIPIKLTKMGLLTEPKNEKQLAKAISEILENQKKYNNKKLIIQAQKIFDIKNVYQFWSKIID
ncbi:MAG: glycosyltransferase family 4 protein [Patescibacteria group bacterium]|nr:glycosyltransferase family 4 protein [Patescibacteria group bacterium]